MREKSDFFLEVNVVNNCRIKKYIYYTIKQGVNIIDAL